MTNPTRKAVIMTTIIVPTPIFQPLANLIKAGSPFNSIMRTDDHGNEFWSARDLMELMGYAAWRNFETPLKRAMKSAENQSKSLEIHFAGSRKITQTKPQEDFNLSRFACYLVAMNGDPNKAEVAAAQAYFAIQTRIAETAPRTSPTGPQEVLFTDDTHGIRIGKPVAELPALQRRKKFDPREARNNKIATVAREAKGAWVPLFIDKMTPAQLNELKNAIKYGARTAFTRGEYKAEIRNDTLYIRHTAKEIQA